jgi:hypothetical protein
VFGLSSWGASCSMPPGVPDRRDVQLVSGDAFERYNTEKQALLGGGFLKCQACADSFNEPTRAGYFGQLTNAVSNQVPYDGVQTTISQYDAGMADGKNPLDVPVKKKVPVCALFVPFKGPNGTVPTTGFTEAASQIKPPLGGPTTHVYINTTAAALKEKNLTKCLTQGTILHEALHNLMGLLDWVPQPWWALYGCQPPYDLKNFLAMEKPPGTDPDPDHGTMDVTTKLEAQGCAGPNQAFDGLAGEEVRSIDHDTWNHKVALDNGDRLAHCTACGNNSGGLSCHH